MKDGYNPKVRNCYFCDGRKFVPYAQATYWKEFPLQFVVCVDCKLIFANPMPNLDTVKDGNQALSILHGSRGILPQYRGGNEFTFELQAFQPGGTLLDVGCAEGIFMLGVEENSEWRAEGIEIIERAVEFATRRLGMVVYCSTLPGLQVPDEKYDFIRMNNVIEHVQNPVRFLRAANRILKKGGRVYCSTPNGFQDGHLLKNANKRGKKINLLENHFFYYHPRTLSAIFKSCGFKIRKHYCEDISHSLNDFGLLPRLKYASETQAFALSAFRQVKHEKEYAISDDEIQSLKSDASLKRWRVRWKRLNKKLFRLHFPMHLPLGHQQHIYAEKV